MPSSSGTHGEGARDIVASFDDGPMQETTVPLLEILKEHDVRAMLFAVGENMEHLKIICMRGRNRRSASPPG